MQLSQVVIGIPHRTAEFLHFLHKSISAHALFWAVIAFYYVGYLLVHILRPDLVPIDLLRGGLTLLWFSVPLLLFSLAVLRFYHVARFDKTDYLTIAVLREWGRFLRSPGAMANGLPMIVIMVIFASIFADLKSSVLDLNPVLWDETLSNIGRTVHFGRLPWEWLQPLFGYPYVTFLLNLNYNIWFFVMWTFFAYFGFAESKSELRTQFFLSFIFTWIIGGTLLAIIFSSAGPCFYSRLGLSPDPYTGLMSYLRTTNAALPIWAIDIQDMLWRSHLARTEIGEISAMPSMHNSTTLLMMLASFRISRFWGWALTAHGILVFVGSVCLAWHYAIDSYVSWVLVVATWFAMGPVARWWHQTPEQKAFDQLLAA